ncbi:hypothetical protein BsWGS_28506 [Bradybaena similaris]
MASTAAKNTVATQVPPLADTDVELWTDCLGDYISAWLKNSQNFFNEQQEKMYRMALCPFLFGVSRNLPQAWLEVLRTYGIVEKDRENITSPLSELQLETLDMAETVFMRCSQLASNKNDLKTILNFIHDVEDRSALSGRIDMNYALQEVSSLEVFSSMW